jgi:predicted DNA-binding transcriptional regulator AlpA
VDLVRAGLRAHTPATAGVVAGGGHSVGTDGDVGGASTAASRVAIAPMPPLLTVGPMNNDNDTKTCAATCPFAVLDDTTWGPHEVGRFLRCSAEKVLQKVGEDPDFPPPLVIGERTKRWLPSAVHAYMQRAHDRRLPVRDAVPGRHVVERV